MAIEIAAFRWVHPMAHGYVRDLWVRWALEEAGLPYETILIDAPDQQSQAYRGWQPFGKVPAYRDDVVTMFESGAIVLHLAMRADVLAPSDETGRARVLSWVLAALNTIDPYVGPFLDAAEMPEDDAGRARADAALHDRLASLSAWLGDRDFLEGRFTAGDLMMTGVLRVLVESGMLARFPNLDLLRQRCEARPAFGRALEAQLRVFRENAPAS